MAELIWQQQINKVIREVLMVPENLPELGRVTGINLFPEVLRGEIYRGSMVVEGAIRCEVSYLAGEELKAPEEAGPTPVELPAGDDLAGTDQYLEDSILEEDLWGADDPGPDQVPEAEPDLPDEPVSGEDQNPGQEYFLHQTFTYRLPVEIPRLQPGQKLSFHPMVQGVDYRIVDDRTLELEVGLSIGLSIEEEAGLSGSPVLEPREEDTGEESTGKENAGGEFTVDEYNDEDADVEKLVDQAVKEIAEGVEAVFSYPGPSAGIGPTEKSDQEPAEVIQEDPAEKFDEGLPAPAGGTELELAGAAKPASTGAPAGALVPDEGPGAFEPTSTEVSVPAGAPEASKAMPAGASWSPGLLELAPAGGPNPIGGPGPRETTLSFAGDRELQHAVGFQNQKLVLAYRVRFHQVREGETLAQVAGIYGTSVEKLAEINQLTGENLTPGQRIMVISRK